MDNTLLAQIVGYAGSGLVVLSLMMRSILRLRLIGLAGATTFLAYGFLIDAIPIVVTNVVIVGVHLFFIRKLVGKHETFSVLRVRPESLYLEHFLEFHHDEIQRFQPGFEYRPADETLTVFILRDLLPAGLLVGVPHPDGSIEVELDYVIPQYRDLKLGRFLYSERAEVFTDGLPTCVWSESWSERHDAYLQRMGFAPARRDGHDVFELPMGRSGPGGR
ncbi:MAG: hypothetical protein V3V29_04335 [Acidimicrobiia bacterium]